MRVGQHVKWESLNTPGRWLTGVVMCFEYDLEGWALVRYDGPEDLRPSKVIRRKRLKPFAWNKGKTAKGGGDDSAPSGVLMAEVA